MLSYEMNDSEIYRSLEYLDEGSRELPLDAIAQIMVDAVHANFDAEGRPSRWAERSDPESSWPILHKTGALEDSIHSVIGSSEVEVTHSTDYGDYHETGTSRMPARPFLTMEPEDMDRIEQTIAEWFDNLNQ